MKSKEMSIEREIELIEDMMNFTGIACNDWADKDTLNDLVNVTAQWILEKGLEKSYFPGPSEFYKIESFSMSTYFGEECRFYIDLDHHRNGREYSWPSEMPIPVISDKEYLFRYSQEKLDEKFVYEIDYRRIEAEGACVFYHYDNKKRIIVDKMPENRYLNRCTTLNKELLSLIEENGYLFFKAGDKYLEIIKEDKHITIKREDKDHPEVNQDLLMKIQKLYWGE